MPLLNGHPEYLLDHNYLLVMLLKHSSNKFILAFFSYSQIH